MTHFKQLLFRSGWLSAVCLIACGCSQEIFRAETVLHNDGSIDRAIYQPVKEMPETALAADLWEGRTYAAEIADRQWEHPIRELPAATPSSDRPYFAAWGHFASPAEIPEYYHKSAPEGLPAGRLARSYERRDLVFVVEHRWRETLTDIVTLSDMREARDELATLLIDFAEAVLKEYLGDQYDASALLAWLRSEGRAWFNDSVETFFEFYASRQGREESVLQQRLAKIAARHGLDMTDEKGQMLPEEALQTAIREFVAARLRQGIRRRDGKPLEEDVVERLLIGQGLQPLPDLPEPPEGVEPPEVPDFFTAAVERVVARQFGGAEVFEERLNRLVVRIAGLYRSELFASPRQFQMQLTMPGFVVESNGVLLSENELEWNFNAKDAYPYGYAMTARSLVPNRERQKQLLKTVRIDNRKRALEFVSLVEADRLLLTALQKVAEANHLRPLHEYRSQVLQGEDDAAIERVQRLWKLLGLDVEMARLR